MEKYKFNQILLVIASMLVFIVWESVGFILPALKNEFGDSNYKYYLVINIVLLWETVILVAYLIWQMPGKKTLFVKIMATVLGAIVCSTLIYITIHGLRSF